MKPNLENLRNHYKELSDHKLIELATLEARNLHEEAVEILRDEIKSRGLAESILTGVDVQLNTISEKKYYEYCTLMQLQPCPWCGSTAQKLSAAIIDKVESIVV